jgi:hypothetical protein
MVCTVSVADVAVIDRASAYPLPSLALTVPGGMVSLSRETLDHVGS